MIGGIVVDVVRPGDPGARRYKVVEDGNLMALVVAGTRCEAGDISCVKVSISEKVKIGDMVWWQGGNVMWTPKTNEGESDIEIRRYGYSY